MRLHASSSQEALQRIQEDLFSLCTLVAASPGPTPTPLQPTWALDAMEADIDRLMTLAPPLRRFILPGGCPASAHAHVARTICRRAEREAVALASQEGIHPGILPYLNRLSDWLFALARAENASAGVLDVEWDPGKTP